MLADAGLSFSAFTVMWVLWIWGEMESRELAIDAGPWQKGTRLTAWCVAHFTLRDGRIAHIEQHDCYEPPVAPG